MYVISTLQYGWNGYLHFAVGMRLLQYYESNLGHLSYFNSLVIVLYKS